MVNPIPDNVKQVLSGLSTQQQALLGAYIASLREEIKDYESAGLAAKDEDPHAHYHGHEKCTSEHSHGTKSHEETETHKHCTEDHSHAHGHHHEESQEHDHDTHKEKHHGHDHGHEPEQSEHDVHEHHGHSQEHAQTTNEVPAWKKRALEAGASDPMAAPFGGSWTTEASLSATDDKMKE
jgi:hypothetical protein